jgi:serine phosphatase RsbU (regulator of sigma subunit)
MVAKRRPSDDASLPDPIGHYLVAYEGAQPGKRVEIGAEPLTIGRDVRQTLVFAADTEMSRVHARVSFGDGKVTVEDLGSTNGTFVDGKRITCPVALREGSVLRVGAQLLVYERRSRSEVKRAKELERDLRKARGYVEALLPAPLDAGPVRTEWRFVPSAQLGGDGFGYDWLDPATFVFYLLDVSGHGVQAAMHSVTVLNVLRQRALPDVDFTDPAQVLSSLNARFDMETFDGMYFTIWYGIYRTSDRTLAYSAAGHHPAYLVGPDRSAAAPVGAPAVMIGAMPNQRYQTQQTTVAPGSLLYLFSDGVYEIPLDEEETWGLSDFIPHMLAPPIAGTPESERLYGVVKQVAKTGLLKDDFSLLVATFP